MKIKNYEQDGLNGDLEFIAIIGLRGKSASYWTSNKRQYWKLRGGSRLIDFPYRNLMLDRWVLRTKEVNSQGKLITIEEIFLDIDKQMLKTSYTLNLRQLFKITLKLKKYPW